MDDSLVSLLRMLERLLVVGFGGMSIYLGYKLFFHLPNQADQKGKFDLPGIKIILSKVAPGIFFLAFGAIILLHNLDTGIKQTVSTPTLAKNNQEVIETFAGVINLSGNNNKQGILQRRNAAIEQIGELNCMFKILVAKQVEIPASMHIAQHEAKVALLKPVWNESAWDDIKVLEFGSDSITNKNLKGVFTDESVSCQY